MMIDEEPQVYPEQLLGKIAKKAFQTLGCSADEFFEVKVKHPPPHTHTHTTPPPTLSLGNGILLCRILCNLWLRRCTGAPRQVLAIWHDPVVCGDVA